MDSTVAETSIDLDALTEDEFLGGQLRLLQPRHGYRAGMDAVLLAASVPAEAGQAVLDLGCGVGTAGLCLARRVDGLRITGVELQPDLSALATENAARNGLAGRATFIAGDLRARGSILEARSFDHVICNPPYVAEDSGQTSGTARADLSKRETDADLADWIDAMLYWVRERGYLSLVHRTDRLHDIISLLTPRVGGIRVCPIWPKPGRDANRVLVRGRREARAGMVLGPGITVRGPEDRVTAEMEAIQRDGQALVF